MIVQGLSRAALAVALLAGSLAGMSAVPRPTHAEPPVYTQKELDQMRDRITRYERREADAQAALDKATTNVGRAMDNMKGAAAFVPNTPEARRPYSEGYERALTTERAARARYNELHAYVISLTERWIRESERTRSRGEAAPAPLPKTTRADPDLPATASRPERPRRERRSPPSRPERSIEGGGVSVGSGG